MTDPLYQKIYAVTRQIPSGQVSTYGQIAAIVGRCSARQVGYAMAALPDNHTRTPWHRVINAKGEISARGGGGSILQRELLEKEGVAFDEKSRVDFEAVGWRGPDKDWLKTNNCYPAPPLGKGRKGAQMSLF